MLNAAQKTIVGIAGLVFVGTLLFTPFRFQWTVWERPDKTGEGIIRAPLWAHPEAVTTHSPSIVVKKTKPEPDMAWLRTWWLGTAVCAAILVALTATRAEPAKPTNYSISDRVSPSLSVSCT
jgi:hypothetical protein